MLFTPSVLPVVASIDDTEALLELGRLRDKYAVFNITCLDFPGGVNCFHRHVISTTRRVYDFDEWKSASSLP